MTVLSQQLPLFARKVREQMSGSSDKLITSGALTTPETALAATMAGNDARGRGKTITPTYRTDTDTLSLCHFPNAQRNSLQGCQHDSSILKMKKESYTCSQHHTA